MSRTFMKTIYFLAILAGIGIYGVGSAKAQNCRDEARATDVAVRAYREAVRDLSQSCTKLSNVECFTAETALQDALDKLIAQNASLMDICYEASPTPPDQPQAGDLVITEIMVEPKNSATPDGQWFEIRNVSAKTLDLNGTVIEEMGDLGGYVFSWAIEESLLIEPGEFLVFGRTDDQNVNGGVPVDYVLPNLQLSYFNLDIRIANTFLYHIDLLELQYAVQVPQGAAISLDPASQDSGNTSSLNWCAATTPLPNGDFGSPGVQNPDCP